ncbi:hypothetical protein AM228_28380, partial [Planktothricoides sp. SR001]|uniref:hypothetical protein n=1 Tax=Planktothricoides sp. SR001 TaxID=1705388 RepID=UPI0006C291DD
FLIPADRSETGFLIGISQLSVESKKETRFLSPRRPPRNPVSSSSQLTQKPGFFSAYHSYL